MTEAMGTEGRQARRPRLSVTHLEDRGSLHGIVRMPRIIRKSSSTAVENNLVILDFDISLNFTSDRPNLNQPESNQDKCLLDAIERPFHFYIVSHQDVTRMLD